MRESMAGRDEARHSHQEMLLHWVASAPAGWRAGCRCTAQGTAHSGPEPAGSTPEENQCLISMPADTSLPAVRDKASWRRSQSTCPTAVSGREGVEIDIFYSQQAKQRRYCYGGRCHVLVWFERIACLHVDRHAGTRGGVPLDWHLRLADAQAAAGGMPRRQHSRPPAQTVHTSWRHSL